MLRTALGQVSDSGLFFSLVVRLPLTTPSRVSKSEDIGGRAAEFLKHYLEFSPNF